MLYLPALYFFQLFVAVIINSAELFLGRCSRGFCIVATVEKVKLPSMVSKGRNLGGVARFANTDRDNGRDIMERSAITTHTLFWSSLLFLLRRLPHRRRTTGLARIQISNPINPLVFHGCYSFSMTVHV